MYPTPPTSATAHTDGPSPSKRRKLATPAPASNSSPFSHGIDPQLDIERRGSSSRVLSVWSALEDKYVCRLNEDDIVDLRSGGLVKDRGVLSGKTGSWDIGCFADPEEARAQENTALEEEDDDDEIGIWGSDAELDHRLNPLYVPPVRELDPEDAEDLRAFLAAEKARRALDGVDHDLSEDEPETSHSGGEDHHEKSDVSAESDESTLEVEAGSALALSPTESDDELAGYDETVGEGALLWEVSTELSNCSEPLGADTRMTPHPPPALPRRNQTLAHLHTPPLSRSSIRPHHDPDVTKSSPRPRNTLPCRNQTLAQLHTPPLSRSSRRSPLGSDVPKASPQPRNIVPLKPPLSPSKTQGPSVWVSLPKKRVSIQPSPDKRIENSEAQSPRRRHPTPNSPRAPTGSTSIEKSISSSPSHHAPQRASSSHPSPVPLPPSRDFWPSYPHSGHAPAPALFMPYPPPPNRTRESSIAPEAQIIIAQAVQSLSYLAFGVPPPSPPSRLSPHPHPRAQYLPSSPLHPPSPWSYPSFYHSHQNQTHVPPPPPWPYPPYPYHHSPAPHTHPAALPPFSTTPFTTHGSGGEPPSSPPEFSSSPQENERD